MSKVFVVEDDNILAKAITTALTQAGFQVEAAIDGQEALDKIPATEPDLILLDLLLPKKSGEEVLAELKKNEATKDIPVLIATVKDDNDTISRCVALGIRGYFIKAHYTLDQIVETIEKVMAERGK